MTGGSDDPYQRSLLIQAYLASGFQYNTQVAVPPAGQEFVSWFLETKEGYCVYFATAFTMLCRLSGVPARYVEGYYAPPAGSADGSRQILASYAHAWSEVYLAGIGWVPFDPTTGGPAYTGTPTPRPTVTPAPTRLPVSPKPLPLTPEPTRPVGPGQDDRPADWSAALLLMLLLAAFLLPTLYIWRAIRIYRFRHNREWLCRHFADDRRQLRYYWLEIQRILAGLGMARPPAETPRAFFERVRSSTRLFKDRPLTTSQIIDDIEMALYSRHAPDPDALGRAAWLYDDLEETLRLKVSPFRFWLSRVLRPGLLADPDQPAWPMRSASRDMQNRA
jgi:hypothetical protein